jgi:hypothetical protein
MKQNRKYHYDEQEGVFVFDDEISINWLVSQVLNQPNLQITKLSNEELQSFLSLLSKSDLRMPNGQHSLYWLREQIKEKMQLSSSKLGESWNNTTTRFRFVIEQIDHLIIVSKHIVEKEEPKENQRIINREPNNLEAHFEPI